MNRKLAALLSVVGGLTIGGTAYLLSRADPSAAMRDMLQDAGISADCAPVRTSCAVRDLCQTADKAGKLSRRYRRIKSLAYECPDQAGPTLVQRWEKKNGRDCFEPVGPGACQVLGPDVDDGGTAALPDVDECTCRARGKLCRLVDGGSMDFQRTYQVGAGPFVGAGCEPTPCLALAGEPDEALAELCR